MRATNVIGILGAIVAVAAFLYGQVQGEMPLPAHVALYLGLVGALYWVYFNIEQMLFAMRTRSVQQAGVGLLVVVLAFGVFMAANFIGSQHPERFDATDVGIYTLAPQTFQVLESLDAPVRVIAFFPETIEGKAGFEDLVEGYQIHTEKLTVQWVDPDFEPALTKQYGIRVAGTVVLESGDRTEQLTNPTEETLTNALIAVTRSEKKAVYFVEGNGELSIDQPGERSMMRASEELRKKGFAVESVNLLAEGEIPEDATVLIIAGPQSDLLPKERVALESWMNAGGRLLLLIEPDSPQGYLEIVNQHGIETPEAIVVDMVGQSLVGDATMPVVVPMGYHEITKDMAADMVILRYARPLRKGTGQNGEQVQILFASTQNAWGETDMSAFELVDPNAEDEDPTILQFDEGTDVAGPVEVMGLSVWPVGEPPAEGVEDAPPQQEAMLAVVGDADFASDLLFDAKLNSDLFLNTVSYLAQEADLISIRPRSRDGQPFTPSEAEGALIMYSSLVVLPGLSFLLGLVFYVRRRNL